MSPGVEGKVEPPPLYFNYTCINLLFTLLFTLAMVYYLTLGMVGSAAEFAESIQRLGPNFY